MESQGKDNFPGLLVNDIGQEECFHPCEVIDYIHYRFVGYVFFSMGTDRGVCGFNYCVQRGTCHPEKHSR